MLKKLKEVIYRFDLEMDGLERLENGDKGLITMIEEWQSQRGKLNNVQMIDLIRELMTYLRIQTFFTKTLSSTFKEFESRKGSLESKFTDEEQQKVNEQIKAWRITKNVVWTAGRWLNKLFFMIVRFAFRIFNLKALLMTPITKIKDLLVGLWNIGVKIRKLYVQSKDFAIMDRMLRFDNQIEFMASTKALNNQFNKFKSKCLALDKYQSYLKAMGDQFNKLAGKDFEDTVNYEAIKDHFMEKEHLPIGDIKVVVDDQSSFSTMYIATLEKSGYQLYVKNDLIETYDLESEDRYKAIYQKKILHSKLEGFLDKE